MDSDLQLKLSDLKKFFEKHNNNFFMPETFPIDGFLQAWLEPFSGYDLSWLELEILYRTFSFISIKRLMDNILQDFPTEQRDFSTFYRKVKQMLDRKLLEDEKKGRDKFVRITDLGAIELGKFVRYNMFRTFQIVQTSWRTRLAKLIRERESCFHDKSLITVFNSVNILDEYLSVCEHYDASNEPQKSTKANFFLVFNDKEQITELSDYSVQIIKVDNLSLFLKDNIADLFIANNLLANLKREQIPIFLKELARVMKSGSTVYFAEIKEDVSNPMIENWSMFAQIMQFSQKTWDMKKPYSIEELQPLLEEHFNDIKIEVFGFMNFISAKKST